MKKISSEVLKIDLPTSSQKSKPARSECRICGDNAFYSYVGVIVCSSCKMFFKRNAEREQSNFKCPFEGNCQINLLNRHICSLCRLKKCFASGMKTDMFHCARTKKTPRQTTQLNKEHRQQIRTLNLLENDQSTLDADQWNLLSNLVHCFDQYIAFDLVEQFIVVQNALPIKFRYKHSPVLGFFSSMMSRVQVVVEKNRDFVSLSSDDRSILLRNTVEYTTSFGGMVILRESKLFDDRSFFEAAGLIFQPESAASTRCVIDRLDSDLTFLKLILSIVAFSSSNYTTYSKTSPMNLSSNQQIFRIQNIYIDLVWRYLLHRFDHQHAVKTFSNLIRCLFLVNAAIVEAHEAQQFTEIIDSVLEQTLKINS